MKWAAAGDIIMPSELPSICSNRVLIMANQNANAERYISIARACLKAINETASEKGSREQKIQAVYEAIDIAFQQEFSEYRQSVAVMASVLELIAGGQMDAGSAASLARKTLDQQPASTRDAVIH